MLHARKDYNRRIQDSANIIGEDEPVFLLRAQDKLMLPMLHEYLRLLRESKDYDKSLEVGVVRHCERTSRWQLTNKPKQPDTPGEELVK